MGRWVLSGLVGLTACKDEPTVCDDSEVEAWLPACGCPEQDETASDSGGPAPEPAAAFVLSGARDERIELHASEGSVVSCRHVDCDEDRVSIRLAESDAPSSRGLDLELCRFVTLPSLDAIDPETSTPCPPIQGWTVSWHDDASWHNAPAAEPCRINVDMTESELRATFECSDLVNAAGGHLRIAEGSLVCVLEVR